MNFNSMTITQFVKCAKVLPNDMSILIRGPHGIGKSQVVRQLFDFFSEKGEVVGFIDRRLSQMSEGDVVGLPSTDGEVTRFNPPDWYKRACAEPCVLFLDELNRATQEVMQAAFQIVLDRELNGWRLHPQTRVFAAVNASAEYTVNEIDPALLDRFWCIDLNATVDDWLSWARGQLNDDLVDFIAQNQVFLDPPRNAQLGSVHSSRRSWERLNKSLTVANLYETPEDPMFYSISMGFVGTDSAAKFHDFCKNSESRLTAEEVLNRYKKIRAKVQKVGTDRQNTLVEKVLALISTMGEKSELLTTPQVKNIAFFMEDLGAEQRLNFWQNMQKITSKNFEQYRLIHKHCVKLLLDAFEVPMGVSGTQPAKK
jgi:MoxR-like ATPase